MHVPVDLRKLRYLIDVLGLTLEESLRIDVNLASEYGLLPRLSVAPPAGLSGDGVEGERRAAEEGVA